MGGWRTKACMAVLLAEAVLVLGGCNLLPTTVTARLLTPITQGEIRRIAVLPFTTAGLSTERTNELGSEPLAEPPSDTVTRAMQTAMRARSDWQIVDDLTVGEVFRQLYGEVRAPTAEEALAVGRALRADAVLRGEVRVFDERIGSDLAARRPAHVVFAAELVRMTDGASVWQAVYAEQQQSLSENLWNLRGFVQAGGRWVRARDLAEIGASRLVERLHTTLYGLSPKKAAKTP